ncbi:hypothetical protein AURDEDRAFT_96343 [Auricularia subglabra TFB-10046 SS5]|nr:hypothetical protein AURDEDRAFT_96343 [Auricularia subglabra TFB-10046 SS5]
MRLAGARLVKACANAAPAARRTRGLHYLRPLPYDIERGLGSFLPPDALKVLAIDYQGGLCERLNNLVRGASWAAFDACWTPYESMTLAQTLIASASRAEDIDIFNMASEALNNDFFLDNLRPPLEYSEDDLVRTHDEFMKALRGSFGTLENLKSVVSATAMGMVSSGWVWLVQDGRGDLAALPTFGAGTIILKQRLQNSGIGMSGKQNRAAPSAGRPAPTPSPASGALHVPDARASPRGSRTLHTSFAARAVAGFGATVTDGVPYGRQQLDKTSPVNQQTWNHAAEHMSESRSKVAESLSPLFCISVHERAWMAAGLGVWGREEYLRRFWTALDWHKVLNGYKMPAHLTTFSQTVSQ